MDMKSRASDLRSSSPQQDPESTSNAPMLDNFAFAVHSRDSVSSSFQADTDGQRAAKQKRRRTSPEDQAILEVEYEKNCKPDKAARSEIVKRVTLGEKEVQIWFQNRRQVTRRKSQPFTILPSPDPTFLSSQESLGSSAYSSFSVSDNGQSELRSSQTSYTRTQPAVDTIRKAVSGEQSSQSRGPMNAELEEISRGDDGASKSALWRGNASRLMKDQDQHAVHVNSPDQESTASTGSRPSMLVRSQSSPFNIHQDLPTEPSISSKSTNTLITTNKAGTPLLDTTLRRASSLVRLSMSLEGKAKVAIGSSPSPPKAGAPRPAGGLQRCQSAIEPSKKSSVDNVFSEVKAQKSAIPGRSRDARTWEFYCDSSARDALTEQAEREQSGSAVGAIGLIRSRSNKVLVSNSNKRNARPQNDESTKRLKGDVKQARRQKLNRTQSSVARLQTSKEDSREPMANRAEKSWKPASQLTIDDSGDSDKENWEPGTQSRSLVRGSTTNQMPSSRTRRSVLKESLRVPSQSFSLDSLIAQKDDGASAPTSQSAILSDNKENADDSIDEEVNTFMKGSCAPREPDELDCVQNLLSLSQGKWQ